MLQSEVNSKNKATNVKRDNCRAQFRGYKNVGAKNDRYENTHCIQNVHMEIKSKVKSKVIPVPCRGGP
jgi:hypothetical protein